LVETKQVLPLWIIDEAQNLPLDFFRDLPAFLNFAFDSRDLMTIWLIGHPQLLHTLDRAPYAALKSRISLRLALQPIIERERFADLLTTAIKQAGCQHTLLSDSGLELLRQASQGKLRQAGLLLQNAMQLAVLKKLNHLPDDLIQQTIKDLQ
jgi:MSHA biogenesis protein MshM